MYVMVWANQAGKKTVVSTGELQHILMADNVGWSYWEVPVVTGSVQAEIFQKNGIETVPLLPITSNPESILVSLTLSL